MAMMATTTRRQSPLVYMLALNVGFRGVGMSAGVCRAVPSSCQHLPLPGCSASRLGGLGASSANEPCKSVSGGIQGSAKISWHFFYPSGPGNPARVAQGLAAQPNSSLLAILYANSRRPSWHQNNIQPSLSLSWHIPTQSIPALPFPLCQKQTPPLSCAPKGSIPFHTCPSCPHTSSLILPPKGLSPHPFSLSLSRRQISWLPWPSNPRALPPLHASHIARTTSLGIAWPPTLARTARAVLHFEKLSISMGAKSVCMTRP
ncbi:hypothetical protein L1887_47884 [Cichorium endivia]|nr:hypothetical protein L1887_47884 [Cichorium endivia]